MAFGRLCTCYRLPWGGGGGVGRAVGGGTGDFVGICSISVSPWWGK